ncbi:uncharacterized protein LOC116349214 [Contarinia nasturtii]|uniref:uncharacterized protein LOC116349214 n=1 Tax=Contarinia nasturtii TaxID=265458 RepID=UPI0012D385E4|nr:uncharacterized protein LOC116349214 [Contarinia nasturtii]
MLFKCVIGVWMITIAVKSVRCDDIAQNEIQDSNYGGDQYGNRQEIENVPGNGPNDAPIVYGPQPPSGSWFDSARNALNGPTGQIVVSMAREMISRSTGNSQILSLNLTNLLILVMLKALIFAAGLIGAGNWGGQYARARALDSSFIRTDEAPLFIGYLALEGSGQDGCLNQAACKSPDIAREYMKAAMAVIKGSEMFDQHFFNTTRLYSYTLNQMEHSIQRGIDGDDCDLIYHCHL